MTFLCMPTDFCGDVERKQPVKIALIDDCELEHQLFRYCLNRRFGEAYALTSAYNLDEAMEVLDDGSFDYIFLDNRLKPNRNFSETLPHINKKKGEAKVFLISACIVDPIFKFLSDFHVDGLIDKLGLGDKIMSGQLLHAAV